MTYEDKDGNEITETVPNNVYQIISEMEDSLTAGNRERLSALNDHLTKAYDNLMKNVSDLGVKCNYLETMQAKYEDEGNSIAEMQTDLEGIKDADEIINLGEYKYSWQLTLQFGSSILPQTLMSYLD